MRWLLIAVLGMWVLGALATSLPDRARAARAAAAAGPVALALVDNGRWLFTANRSGSVTTLDTQTRRTVAEVPVGRKLADLTAAPDGGHLLAVDEDAHELIVLVRREAAVEVLHRVPVAPFPVNVQVTPDGRRAIVASLWSRRLTVIELSKPRVVHSIPLPFAPRCQLLLSDTGKLLVADAFGGRLAVVDLARGVVETVHTLPAHNIRGLARSADGKTLLVAHLILHSLAQTTRDDIHWGNLLANCVRAVPLDHVLRPGADLFADGRLHQIGEPGRGAGDPSGLALAPSGTLLVALGGVNELAVGPERDGTWQRVAVGRRPTALAVSPDGRRAYVANTFGDSVSVVDLAQRKLEAEIPLGPSPEPGPNERGERLFYNARLAFEGWMSCHSCHTDGHTNGQLSDTLGDGSFGAPKRVLSLLGTRDTAPWAWNGSLPDLESQVRKSVASTMHGPKLSEDQVRDLTAFVRTLPAPPAVASFDPTSAEARERGRRVFEKQGCAQCHAAPAYTSRKTYDVGLADEVGNRQFNPPSLRGVSQGGSFFHDGRAMTLEEVFTRHRHQLKEELTKPALDDLLAFLRGL